MTDPFETAASAAAVLADRTGASRHSVAVVLGSGWLPAADALGADGAAEVGFDELGGFPVPTVAGHAGKVLSTLVGDRRVLVFLGRVHLYEGHPPSTVVHGVRTAIAAGCETIILTNAAGGLNPAYTVGQAVLVADHLNLTAQSPLTGPAPPQGYAARFVDLTDLYSPRLRALALEVDPSLTTGVYVALPGPHYETPAEVAMLRLLGGDLVGMSTALEAIAARHGGAEVMGLSLVTNVAAGLGHESVNHEEVLAAGAAAASRVGALLAAVIARLP
ncbi:MAG TPA: purine-nucleoside phosphorylase [Acidimicrobiales bacterium]|nr:purine-nucleoside phosphorylase [Acidimicrobiales bacterium]